MAARRTRKKKSPRVPMLYVVSAVFATGIIISSYWIADPASQTAAAAAAQPTGACQQAYEDCMKDSKPDHPILGPEYCENTWETCVRNKCVKPITKSTSSQCANDTDCESSCTEVVSSTRGLLSCCLGGPKHENTCPKQIDYKCTNSSEIPKVFPGAQYDEGDKIPNPRQEDPFNNLGLDKRIELPSPSFPMKFPDGTVFTEQGVPSQAPLAAPDYSIRSFDLPPSIHDIWNGTTPELPVEYRPTADDTSRLNTVISNMRDDMAAERVREQETNITAPTYTVSNMQSTFGNPGPNTSVSSCRVRFFGWCLW